MRISVMKKGREGGKGNRCGIVSSARNTDHTHEIHSSTMGAEIARLGKRVLSELGGKQVDNQC